MRRHVLAVPAAVLALAVGVSGCGGDKPPPPPSKSATASPPESPVFDPPLAFAATPVRIPVPSRMFQARDGVVYLLQDNNALAAYELATGARRWSAPLADPPARLGNTRPMIAEVDGKPTAFVTYRVAIEGRGTVPDRTVLRVTSFGLADGAPGWQSDVDDKRIPEDFAKLGVDKVVAASPDHVVVSTDSHDTGGLGGDFSAVLDARTGKIRWTKPAFQARALDGDIVAGMSSEPDPDRTPSSTIGLAASDGSQVWAHKQTRPAGELINGPLGGGLLQVYPVGRGGDGPNGLLDTKTGREVIRLAAGSRSSVCRYDEESVVVCSQHLGSRNGTMAAYDARSYKRLWQVPEKDSGREAPRLSAARRGMVYGSTSNGPLILDARTGQDKVTDLPFSPEVVIAGFGIEADLKELTAYPAIS